MTLKRVIYGAIAAWTGIVALAWWLADVRTGHYCHTYGSNCDPSLLAQRDYLLVVGLVVPLALFVALLVAGLIRLDRVNQPGAGPPEGLTVNHSRSRKQDQ